MTENDAKTASTTGVSAQNSKTSPCVRAKPGEVRDGRQFTPEQRARAAARRAEKRAARAADTTLVRSHGQDPQWREVATIYHVQLPPWGEPMTPATMRRWLRKCRFTIRWFKSWFGRANLQQFIDDSPTWPLRAWAGMLLLLREADDKHGLPTVIR